ncbi:MAG: hypothetical protein IPP48_14090 [Chitinophagaceae bacterium]|nr:hypothetical protein [Chitinophagaceae bacterium]
MGDFYQGYVDSAVGTNTIFGRGFYYEGLKNGVFEWYYNNGNLRCTGSYQNDLPIGKWIFFYNDGKPERTLLFTSVDTFLIDFYDKKGELVVANGNGIFNGFVNANDNLQDEITAYGSIVNGKPHGKWSSQYYNQIYTNEVFENGKFIEGGFPNSSIPSNKKYDKYSLLNNFMLFTYINKLEIFALSNCYKNASSRGINNSFDTKQYNLDNFKSFANDAIKRTIESDGRNGNSREYLVGENRLIISFSVNDKGIPEKFARLSGWGDQFFYPVTQALTAHAKFPPNITKKYFHLVLTLDGGNTLGYRFFFSDNQDTFR